MTDSIKPPLPGRILGLAVGVLAVAVAGRVAWELLHPLVPLLAMVVGLAVVYRVMAGKIGH